MRDPIYVVNYFALSASIAALHDFMKYFRPKLF